jgi:hypothetical protein
VGPIKKVFAKRGAGTKPSGAARTGSEASDDNDFDNDSFEWERQLGHSNPEGDEPRAG